MKGAVHFTFKRDGRMIRKTLINVGVAALLGGVVMASQAATMTLNTWTFGSGNAVNVSAPTYNGQGGGFSGTLSGAGVPFDGAIKSYCVEVGEFFNFGTAYNTYNVVTSVSYFGASKALSLAKLLTYANPLVSGAADKDYASTALQLAIWNTVYDTDLSLSAGTFKNTSDAGLNTLATSFLTGATSAVNNLQLFVLSSGKPLLPTAGQQDQLIWLDGGGPSGGNVPEPTSLALAFGALGALGFATTRRRRADQA
jgi:Thioester domain